MDRNRPEEKRLSLAQLTEAAGVSVRTVRYYIAEGLLPPPLGSGPASFYTPAHLRRLQVIGRLKEAYLPLKEIRRRLTGVDDAELPRLLELDDAALFDPATWEPFRGGAAPETVTSYVSRAAWEAQPKYERPRMLRELTREAASVLPLTVADSEEEVAFDLAPQPAPPEPAALASKVVDPSFLERRRDQDREQDREARYAMRAKREPGSLEEAGEPWRRLALGDGIELLVSERAWRRNREKLDWLANWAKKVFR